MDPGEHLSPYSCLCFFYSSITRWIDSLADKQRLALILQVVGAIFVLQMDNIAGNDFVHHI